MFVVFGLFGASELLCVSKGKRFLIILKARAPNYLPGLFILKQFKKSFADLLNMSFSGFPENVFSISLFRYGLFFLFCLLYCYHFFSSFFFSLFFRCPLPLHPQKQCLRAFFPGTSQESAGSCLCTSGVLRPCLRSLRFPQLRNARLRYRCILY